MKWLKKKFVKIIGYSFIFITFFVAAIIIFIFAIETIDFSDFRQKKWVSELHETQYYGKSLKNDPYEKFAIQYLHPYYFFSLPWTEIDRLKANNDYVSVGEDGFRINPFQRRGGEILLLGGSTAFGHFSSLNSKTIAATLSQRLRLNVVNRNAPSWNSHQELIALLKFEDPYIASVSLSTANDINRYCSESLFNSPFKDQMESFSTISKYFNDLRASSNREFSDMLKTKAEILFPHSYELFKSIKSMKFVYPDEHHYCNGEEGVQEIAKVILNNQKRMELISHGRKARHLLVIQPWYPMHDKSEPYYKQKYMKQINFNKQVIKAIMRDDFCKKSCVDFSKIFDNSALCKLDQKDGLIFNGTTQLDSAVFVDNVHLTDKGVECVVKHLERSLKKVL